MENSTMRSLAAGNEIIDYCLERKTVKNLNLRIRKDGPGAIYGQYDPIPSIRFINMRDGIEDYQMLCMLEQYKGVDYADQLASHIVTSPVTFTRDGDVVYNVHAYMLRQLEAAMQ